jgi:hypothetical protein
MIELFVTIIVCVAIITIVMLSFKEQKFSKLKIVLKDLGINDEESTPFYKWGWHAEKKDRISAERLVRKVFRTNGLWLNKEDLLFFEKLCDNQSDSNEGHNEAITERINTIIKQTEHIQKWVNEQINSTIRFIVKTTPQEALNFLQKTKIITDSDKSLSQFSKFEFTRMLYRIGSKVIGESNEGLQVIIGQDGPVYQLKGIETWEQLLTIFQSESNRLISQWKRLAPAQVYRPLNRLIETELLPKLIRDVDYAKTFYRRMTETSLRLKMNLSKQSIQQFDSILYTWRFQSESEFTHKTHNRFREMLLREDLAPRFREILIQSTKNSTTTPAQIIKLFPKDVIVYGENESARHYLCDQYLKHYMALLEAFIDYTIVTDPPIILAIPEGDIIALKRQILQSKNTVNLSVLIEKRQKVFCAREDLDDDFATKRGWIINLPLYDISEKEEQALKEGSLNYYVHFNCDVCEEADFTNVAHHAKQSRYHFLHLAFDSLLQFQPPYQTSKSSDQST